MSFAFPQFLWALSALSIPILIHLFNFRRTTRVFFSNTRFLQQVRQETTQKRKLKQYLVLASRLLFVFFLVAAFAQPFLPAKEQFTSGREINLYLDNSYSMLSSVGEKNRALDAGIRFCQEVVTLFPADTRYKLLTNDFAPFSNSFKTRTEVLDLLTQIRLSPVSRTFTEIKQRLYPLNGSGREETFWISDFQKSTLGTIDPASVDSLQAIRLVPISFEEISNVLVDSVYLEDPFVVGGQRNILNVRLRNVGVKPRENLVLKLTINDVQAGTASVNLPAQATSMARFDLTQGLGGWNKAVISFTDFPVSFDNEFNLTLNFSEKIKVTEVKEDNPYIGKVFGNRNLFAFRSFDPDNVDLSVVSQSDLVVINGLESWSPAFADVLRNYQKGPGTLLIIPSAKADPEIYKVLVNIPGLARVDKAEVLELDKPDYQNPFFENVFEERSAAMAMPHVKPVLQGTVDRSAILKFKDGKPFMTRVDNTYFMVSPLESGYSDFQNHALFVPVMYRLAASGHRVSQKPYYFLSESMVTMRSDSLDGEAPVRLVGKQEIVPSQRRQGERFMLEIPRFSIEPGFYYAMSRQDTLGLVAFDLDKRESLLEQWTGEEVKSQLGGGKNISLFSRAATGSFSDEIKERYLGTPLWKYALMLALLFVLAEIALIRFLK